MEEIDGIRNRWKSSDHEQLLAIDVRVRDLRVRCEKNTYGLISFVHRSEATRVLRMLEKQLDVRIKAFAKESSGRP